MTLAILLTIEVTLSELILINIGMNIITFVGILFYLKLALHLQLFKQILRFSLGSTTRLQVYLRNFIPNLGGLLLGTVIPVFGLQFLNADELNKLVLTDRFVRSFENIFQSILQWNLKQFKQFQSRDIIIYSAALIAAGLVIIVAAPNLIRLLLNVEFDSIDNIHLQFYSTIIFLGPLITMFGTIYFIFSDRTLEYSLIIIILGIVSIIWISTINAILSITLGLPFLYGITLLMLLLRRKERSSK